jgi:hypothetical protein
MDVAEVGHLRLRSRAESNGGHPGIRYRSNARQGSTEERLLHEVQFALSGNDSPDASEASLFLEAAAVVDGDDVDFVGLWVPAAQQPQAEAMLAERGFTIEQAP